MYGLDTGMWSRVVSWMLSATFRVFCAAVAGVAVGTTLGARALDVRSAEDVRAVVQGASEPLVVALRERLAPLRGWTQVREFATTSRLCRAQLRPSLFRLSRTREEARHSRCCGVLLDRVPVLAALQLSSST